MKAKYDKAEVNVNNVCTALENHQVTLMKDIALLDKMYAVNLTYFKELSMYILAGKKKLEEVRNSELAACSCQGECINLPEDAQAAKDLQSMCDRFEKKIHDLELTRMISIQTAPQIRMVQNNDTLMAEKSSPPSLIRFHSGKARWYLRLALNTLHRLPKHSVK